LISQIHYWAGRARAARSGAAKILTREPSLKPPPPSVSLSTQNAVTTASQKPVVLFVDDDPVMLKAFRRDFLNENIACEFAQTGESALALLSSTSPPDVVVCDLLMPGISGADLYEKAMRIDPSWRKRFIFTTGFSSVSHISAFVESVQGRVLKKPINTPELREAIRYAALTARVFTARNSLRMREPGPARTL